MSYTVRTSLSISAWEFSHEFEPEMVVTYSVTKARPATETDPAEPPSVENITIRLFDAERKEELDCPSWLSVRLYVNEAFTNWLLAEAHDRDEYARERAADALAEERGRQP